MNLVTFYFSSLNETGQNFKEDMHMAVDITVINSNIHNSIQFPPDTFCLLRSLNIIADLRSCSYKLEINW